MSSTYDVVAGDTFESVARKSYGTESEAPRVQRANPGVVEPLQEGTTLSVPVLPSAPVDRRSMLPASSLQEVAIRIDGKRFRFWSSVKIIRMIDSFDMVELTAPFEAEAVGFRETFVPFSFKSIDVTVGGVLLFTGTLVSVTAPVTPGSKIVTASGYSLPGVLNDCTPPASAFPLEFQDQNLRDIAEATAAPFGLSVEFEGDPGAVFERAALDPGKKTLTFLADLAKQRNLVIGNTTPGALLFRRPAVDGVPVANFQQGLSPLNGVVPQFASQEFYSDVTGIEPVFFGLPGSQYTVKNPHLSGVIRPYTFQITDTESAPVAEVVTAKMARMYGNTISYALSLSTMLDPTGVLWAPGSLVTLEAPDAMVYSRYTFIVRGVQITRTREKEEAALTLTLPGSFSGQIPERLPWDD